MLEAQEDFSTEIHNYVISEEERFLKQHGNEFMKDAYPHLLELCYINHFETIKDFYNRRYDKYKGYSVIGFPVHTGDEGFKLITTITESKHTINRYTEIMSVITKPNGESRSWLEIGKMKEYQNHTTYPYQQWIKDPLRYPHRDPRLITVRNNSAKEEQVLWEICIAPDYPLEIRLVSRGPNLRGELSKFIKLSYVDTTERTLWKPK